jgi:hypothetical protein
MVAGHFVRDPEVLSEEPRISFGQSGDAVDYVNGLFSFTKKGPE